MAFPRLTDEGMVEALHCMTEDQQVAFIYRLMDAAYADLISQSWMQRWVRLHASKISKISAAENEDLMAKDSHPMAPKATRARRLDAWRIAHNRPHRRFLRWLERLGKKS